MPDAPTGLQATSVSSSQINLTWDLYPGGAQPDTFITLQHDTDINFGSPTQIELIDMTNTARSVGGLSPSTTYYFRIKLDVLDSEILDSPWSSTASATTDAGTGIAAGLVNDGKMCGLVNAGLVN
jgi:hypothetical protein